MYQSFPCKNNGYHLVSHTMFEHLPARYFDLQEVMEVRSCPEIVDVNQSQKSATNIASRHLTIQLLTLNVYRTALIYSPIQKLARTFMQSNMPDALAYARFAKVELSTAFQKGICF